MKYLLKILVPILLITSASVNAGPQHNMAMKHTNPLPNFMKVIKKFGDNLDLSSQQQSDLAAWRDKNGPVAMQLVQDIISAEKELHDSAFSNTSQQQLQDLMDKVLGMRLQLAQTKISCRENMRTVLNDQQWDKVIALYQEKIVVKP